MLTGSRPLGFTRPLSTPAIAVAPSSPGKKVCTMAAASVAAAPSAYGRPESRTTTTGVPVASRASSSCCWAPGSASDSASHPSPLVPRPNRPARSPSATTTTSAAAASSTAAGMPSVSPPSMVVPSTWSICAAGNSMRSGVEQRRQLDAERDLRMLHADVRRERVAAEQRERVVGVRADDRDAERRARPSRRSAGRRRCAAARPTARRSRARAPGWRADRGRSSRAAPPDRRGRAPRARAARADQPSVEQAEPGLLGEHPPQRAVDDVLGRAVRRAPPRAAARRRCGRSGSSTSIPAVSAAAAASPQLPAVPCSILRNATVK